MEKTGAQILLEALHVEGANTIFGYPGGAVLDIYDALYRDQRFSHYLARHEQGAMHAADGYARASGKVGVCLATSGPGATNTITGIATAYLDSIPVIIITGQVPTPLIGNDAFQEVDIVGISRPCTKHNYLIKDVRDIARIIKEAFHIARSGRPGPVLIDIPKDIQQNSCEFVYPKNIKLKSYNPTYEAHAGQIQKAVNLLHQSGRPVIFVGGGVITSGADQELMELATILKSPVTTTLMGLGCFPADNEFFLGMLGMHGTYRANMAVGNCDLLLAVGVRFDDRVTGKISEFAPKAKIIHIDIDPTSISKNVPVDLPIVSDCKNAMQKLVKEFKKKPIEDNQQKVRDDWFEQIKKWKKTYSLAYNQDEEGPIKPQYVIDMLYEATNGDAIITTEVGQNQMWTAQYYKFQRPRSLITSGGLGTMGFGLPAAIGAQVAFPDRLVIDIAGDGSIQMNIQEMMTAVENCLPIKIVILNNQCLGMVRQWQELFYEKRYSCTNMQHAPDFVKLAEAYGAKGLRAVNPKEVKDVIAKGLEIKGPVIMEFLVSKEEGVYPMVPAGKAITEMLLV